MVAGGGHVWGRRDSRGFGQARKKKKKKEISRGFGKTRIQVHSLQVFEMLDALNHSATPPFTSSQFTIHFLTTHFLATRIASSNSIVPS